MSVKRKLKLIRQDAAATILPYALTLEQRRLQRSAAEAKTRLSDIVQILQTELARLFNDIEFSIDLNLCHGTGLDGWLAESGRLLLECPALVPEEVSCYMAMDYLSVHQLVDICLGGQVTRQPELADKSELSASELRVSGRLLQRQIQAIQTLLFSEQSALSALPVKHLMEPARFHYIPLKVRLVLAEDAISWYLWLPVSFFTTPDDALTEQKTPQPVVAIDNWVHVPVKGHVEMLRRKISLKELQQCLDGKILPVELNHSMRFVLNKKVLFCGKVAEEESSLVFQITELANRE